MLLHGVVYTGLELRKGLRQGGRQLIAEGLGQ